MTWATVAVAGASLVSGLVGAGASQRASEEQVAAEREALAQQQRMFNTIQGNEAPYMGTGRGASSELNYLLGYGTPGVNSSGTGGPNTAAGSSAGGFGSLNAPFTMDTFKSLSPQYGFNLQQGAQGTLNQSASAQGAQSGAALSGLQAFNQNYANNSFNSAFQNYQAQQNNIFTRLSNLATLGSNAGSNSATGASSFANSIGSTLGSIGASEAAGTIGSANALTGGLQSGANAFYGQNALNQILKNGSTVQYSGAPAYSGGPNNPWTTEGSADPTAP